MAREKARRMPERETDLLAGAEGAVQRYDGIVNNRTDASSGAGIHRRRGTGDCMMATSTTDGDGGTRDDRRMDVHDDRQRRNTAWVVGLALVAAGVWALLRSVVRVPFFGRFPLSLFVLDAHAWDLLFLPALGCVFLAWGVVVRKTGLLIPGGVLSGIGLGVMASQGPFGLASGEAQAGVILASMGLGWAAVGVLATTVVDRRAWWPFIPAAVLGALGVALMTVGGAGLATLSKVAVPAGLIGVGIIMVLRRRG